VRLSNRDEWERVRAGGRTRYLVLTGVVRRGLPMGVVVALAVEVLTGRPVPDSLASARFVFMVFAGITLFSLSGCIRAAAQWRLAERRFERRGPSS
jgi:hypothetical protein